MKNAYGWVKDKVERVANSDVYQAVKPHLEEYIYPVLKEQAEKKFKDYASSYMGSGKRGGSYSQHDAVMAMLHNNKGIAGRGLNVAGGSCCHGGSLRVAGRGRQDGGFVFSIPALIAASIAAGKAAGLGAAGAAGALAVNKIAGGKKKKQKGEGMKDVRKYVADIAANKAATIVRKEIMGGKHC